LTRSPNSTRLLLRSSAMISQFFIRCLAASPDTSTADSRACST
jgi:hypothetical protein